MKENKQKNNKFKKEIEKFNEPSQNPEEKK